MKGLVCIIVILLIMMGGFWYLNPKEFYEWGAQELIAIPIFIGLTWIGNKIF